MNLVVSRFLLAFASIWGLGYSAPYVPGEKGAPWTLEEAMVVKAKLLSSMDFNGAWGNMWQVYHKKGQQHEFTGDDMPAESKVCALVCFVISLYIFSINLQKFLNPI